MIGKRAIARFLARPRTDYRTFKKLTLDKLQLLMQKLPARPPIWNKLRIEQRICFIIGARLGRFAFFLDTGIGKTILSIALVWYFARVGRVKHVLVFVPNRVNKDEWAEEIKLHAPQLKYCVLRGSSKHKWEQLRASKALLVIETYAGLSRLVSELVPRKRKKKLKLKPNRKLVLELTEHFQGLIMDESTVVMHRDTLPHRICWQISKRIQIVFALTGTPFGRDVSALWAQLRLVDLGYTLGETLGLFRAVFFTEKENYWGGMEYTFQRKKTGLLHQFLAHRAIRYEADASTLPRVVPIKKIVHLPSDTETYYEKARQAIIAARGNYQEMKNAFVRMRQISSGFVGYKDDETGERAEFTFEQNPKLEMLLSIIQSIDYKAVVFHEFLFSASVISNALKELKIGHAILNGKTKDPDIPLEQFAKDPKCRVFILNSAAGSFGLNRLRVARYGIYYESPVSVIIRKQTRRRVERQGSQHSRVFVYDLVCADTVDEKILEFHRQGGDLFKAIVDGKVRL